MTRGEWVAAVAVLLALTGVYATLAGLCLVHGLELYAAGTDRVRAGLNLAVAVLCLPAIFYTLSTAWELRKESE